MFWIQGFSVDAGPLHTWELKGWRVVLGDRRKVTQRFPRSTEQWAGWVLGGDTGPRAPVAVPSSATGTPWRGRWDPRTATVPLDHSQGSAGGKRRGCCDSEPRGCAGLPGGLGVMGTAVPGTLGICPYLRLLSVFQEQQLLLIPPSNLL